MIKGRVFDADQEGRGNKSEGGIRGGIESARVFVERGELSSEETEASSVTDERGHFELTLTPSDVKAEVITLRFEASGYEPTRLRLSTEALRAPISVSMIRAAESTAAKIEIEETEETEETVITVVAARRPLDPLSTTQLTPRDLSSAPRRNAEEVLRQVPGLTLVQHGSEGKGHQFFLRGFDAIHGADLELTLDGVPINEWSNIHAQGYLDLAMIIPELIRTVSVTKGPFTLEQGAFSMAGAADYQLGAPLDERGWRASYTAGTTNRHRIFMGYASRDEPHQLLGVEATHDEGFGDRRAINRATVNGRARLLDLDGGGTLMVTGLGSYASFELPTPLRDDDVAAERVDFYGTYDPRSAGMSARTLFILQYDDRREWGALSITGYGGYRALELLENFTGFLGDPERGDRRDQRQETTSFGLFGSYESQLARLLSLYVGLGARGDVFAQREASLDQSLEVIEPRRELDALQVIAHSLAGLRWSPSRRVRVDGGARVDVIHVAIEDLLRGGARGEETITVASPRVTARWRALDALRLSLSYGRGFRPPEARAFSSFDPRRVGIGDEVLFNSEPIATISDALELSARWAPSRLLRVSLSSFATLIERESVFDHVSGASLELNGTRRVGGELIVTSNPLSWLRLSADLTWVDARFSTSGERVPFAPWLVSGLRATVTRRRGLQAGLRLLGVAPRPLPHGATGATLLMTDATLGYHWDQLHLDLELENLLNRRLREGEYHYASDWRLSGSRSELPTLHTMAGPPLNARLTLKMYF